MHRQLPQLNMYITRQNPETLSLHEETQWYQILAVTVWCTCPSCASQSWFTWAVCEECVPGHSVCQDRIRNQSNMIATDNELCLCKSSCTCQLIIINGNDDDDDDDMSITHSSQLHTPPASSKVQKTKINNSTEDSGFTRSHLHECMRWLHRAWSCLGN